MFHKFNSRISIEKAHFDELGIVVKHSLYSYILYLICYPIIGIFINAFFWRQTNDVTLIAIYNLGFFLALPLAFYLNGHLLKRFNILKLYWIGSVLQGLAAFLAIFVPDLNLVRVLIYGLIYGLGGGLFWANKNYLTQKITKGVNRLYYNNIESAIELIANIILPALIGWLIVFGGQVGFYSPDIAYKVLMVITMGMLALSGYILQSANIYSETITHHAVSQPSKYWKLNRLIQVLSGIQGGINSFMPSLLILMFVGAEGQLGLLESITAGITALILYVVGRKAKHKHSFAIILTTTSIFFIGVVLYNATYGYLGALIYTIISNLTGPIGWTTVNSNSMEVLDREIELGHNSNQYVLVFDNELWLNVGRIFGMGLFFGITWISAEQLALRLTPLILGALQFALLIPLSALLKYVATTAVESGLRR